MRPAVLFNTLELIYNTPASDIVVIHDWMRYIYGSKNIYGTDAIVRRSFDHVGKQALVSTEHRLITYLPKRGQPSFDLPEHRVTIFGSGAAARNQSLVNHLIPEGDLRLAH